MKDIWRRLESQFSRVPGAEGDLRGGIQDDVLGRLRDVAGRELPEDLVASLKIHDGQHGDIFLFGPYRLSTSDQMIDACKTGLFDRMFGKKSAAEFLPVADNGGSAELQIDLGTGQICDVWEDGDKVVFKSLSAFLDKVSEDLDGGRLEFDEESGSFVVKGDPDAYWP